MFMGSGKTNKIPQIALLTKYGRGSVSSILNADGDVIIFRYGAFSNKAFFGDIVLTVTTI